jgi:peptidoglycan pentaglycine glycine transferase (the first glycine)
MGVMMDHETSRTEKNQNSEKWKAWDEFLAEANSGFRQSSWYADFKAAYNGWDHFGTVLRDGENIVGGVVVFVRSFTSGKCYYYVPDGPVLLHGDSHAEQEQIFLALMQFIERKRRNERQIVSHLCIAPRWERVPSFVKEFQESSYYYGLPRDTQCIDLNPTETAILAQMQPKGRYNIRLAQRHGVSVVEDVSPQGISDLLSICQETFARKNLSGFDPNYFSKLVPMLSAADRGSVFFAEYHGARLATALVVYFGETATYYHGGSRAADRNVMAPYLLHFEIMRKAKALGCRSYDWFGVNPKSAPARMPEWAEISAFKRKFGGKEIRWVPTLEYVYDPVSYDEWRAIERERRKSRHGDRGGNHS